MCWDTFGVIMIHCFFLNFHLWSSQRKEPDGISLECKLKDHGGERLVRYRCQNNSKVASPMRFHQVPSFVMTKDENSRKKQ